MVMVAQLCAFTKNHWTVYLKLMNHMIYKICLNKVIFKCFKNDQAGYLNDHIALLKNKKLKECENNLKVEDIESVSI